MGPGYYPTFAKGAKTAAAGTKINHLIPPHKGKKTKVTSVTVTAGATAHTLTCLRPLGTTTLAADAAAAQAVVVLTAEPGDYDASTTPRTADNVIASADYLAIEAPDGTVILDTTASARNATTGVVTMTTNIPTGGVKAGAKVWFYGISSDTDPHTAEAHPFLNVPASATTTWAPTDGSVFESLHAYEPLILQDNNATTAGTIENCSGVYGP